MVGPNAENYVKLKRRIDGYAFDSHSKQFLKQAVRDYPWYKELVVDEGKNVAESHLLAWNNSRRIGMYAASVYEVASGVAAMAKFGGELTDITDYPARIYTPIDANQPRKKFLYRVPEAVKETGVEAVVLETGLVLEHGATSQLSEATLVMPLGQMGERPPGILLARMDTNGRSRGTSYRLRHTNPANQLPVDTAEYLDYLLGMQGLDYGVKAQIDMGGIGHAIDGEYPEAADAAEAQFARDLPGLGAHMLSLARASEQIRVLA